MSLIKKLDLRGKVRNLLFPLLILLFFNLSFTSCAQIINPFVRLITFIISLPFKIIGMVFKLLPYAVRYAPLALLLVKSDMEHLDAYYAMMEEPIKVLKVSPEYYCLVLDLKTEKNKQLIIDHAVLKEDRVLFLKEMDPGWGAEETGALFKYMEKEGLYLAYDNRLQLNEMLTENQKV